MNLSAKYDALLERFLKLEDENVALLAIIRAVRSCATARELKELDMMVVEHGNATDCARGIMITPAVWGQIQSVK